MFEISLARRDVLTNVQPVQEAVCVDHLGGETFLEDAGSFVLDDRQSMGEPVVLTGVFAVDAAALPAGIVALLGVGDIRFLGLSLDAIADQPGCSWDLAKRRTRRGTVMECLCSFWSSLWSS